MVGWLNILFSFIGIPSYMAQRNEGEDNPLLSRPVELLSAIFKILLLIFMVIRHCCGQRYKERMNTLLYAYLPSFLLFNSIMTIPNQRVFDND